VIGPYLDVTLSGFELGFRRDDDPETEVGIWLGLTAVWIAYHEKFLEQEVMSLADERRLISALIAIASGVDDASQLGVPAKIGQRLLECYAAMEDAYENDSED